MLLVSWAVLWTLWRKGGAQALNPWVLRGLVAMTFSGWVATLAGWYTTEIGRQPWVVQGVLATKDAVADVPAPMVAGSLTAYLAVYVFLLTAYITVMFGLARKAAKADRGAFDLPDRRSGRAALAPAE
jgi:cytochrome d ubiquinol oxidase subunit I